MSRSRPEAIPFSFEAIGRLPRGLFAEVGQVLSAGRKFNREVLRPRALELDELIEKEPDALPVEIVLEAVRRGFFSRWLPKVFGGGGYSPFSMIPFNEEIGSECLGAANLIGAHYVAVSLLAATLNFRILRELCQDVLAREALGEPCLFSTAITEATAGSDLEDADLIERAEVHCHAKRVEGGYHVTGSKVFISNAHLARWHVVTAYADLRRPRESIVVFVVPSSAKGLKLGRVERKLGQHLCPAGELIFEDCFVEDRWVALDSRQYSDAAAYRKHCGLLVDDVISLSRAGVGALGAGVARGTLEETLAFCLKQEQGGKLLINHEWVQALIAEMRKNTVLSRASYWETNYLNAIHGPYRDLNRPAVFSFLKWIPAGLANRIFGGMLSSPASIRSARKRRLRDASLDSEISSSGSLAKFAATDLAMENCKIAIDLMGRSGLSRASRVQKILRDAKLLQIYEGTNQLNRVNLFKRAFAERSETIRVFE